MDPYLRLQSFAVTLKEAQPAAEDAAPHLIDHVDKAVQTLWKQMKDAFAREFEETLTKMKWPGKEVNLSGKLEQEWTTGVEKLLDLQEPYVRILIYGLLCLDQVSCKIEVVSEIPCLVLFSI